MLNWMEQPTVLAVRAVFCGTHVLAYVGDGCGDANGCFMRMSLNLTHDRPRPNEEYNTGICTWLRVQRPEKRKK